MTEKKSEPIAAMIQPFEYKDEVTGDDISVSVSDLYSKLTINNREYFFERETGEFDGSATILARKGPILAFERE